MIELPETATLARQMSETIAGKRVAYADRGDTVHKWVFYDPKDEDLGALMAGKAVGRCWADGKCLYMGLEPGMALMFGEMGGRVLYHAPGATLPPKRHLTVGFEDGSALTASIQGWGFISVRPADSAKPEWATGVSPLDEELTVDRLAGLLDAYPERQKNPVKAFLVSKPCICGIGNGMLHDVLFRAGIRPTRKVRDIAPEEAPALHAGIRETMAEAIRLGGRDTERDLFGNPGGYRPILDKRAAGKPCLKCGAAIEAIKLMGGSCYYCPECQR